jgi:hypothetical protein
MRDNSKPSGGRKPPPIEYRFLKGKSGNPKGRPLGSISLSKAAQKVALKQVEIAYGERKIRRTVLEHVLEVLKREAARGVPSMITELARIHARLAPAAEEQRGNFLIVPEGLTSEEWIAQAEKHNATARDPSLPWEPDPEAEAAAAAVQLKRDLVSVELEKARKGRPSPLGEAMLAYERKWGESYDPVTDQ